MIDIQSVLVSHAQWLADPATGQRAILSGANLNGANLSRANLNDANLSRANLSGAILSDATLSGANLNDANLSRANLSGAILIDATLSGANLNGANLSRAILRGAILSGAKGLPIAVDASERLGAAATAALAEPNALQMEAWHTCDTTHCLGGWAIHQAGPLGAVLEGALGAPIAALLLLGPEAQSHFWDSNEDARVYLQSVLDAAA